MATGLARGACARGKRIAFGDGRKLIWGPYSEIAFRHNPNIAGKLGPDVEWIRFHKGNRQYNTLGNGRWIWNYDYKARPGEFYFDEHERAYSVKRQILIEPNVPWHKPVAPNKDWSLANYQALADRLLRAGFAVWQLSFGRARLRGVQLVETGGDFRCAAAALAGFDLVICPEGGLHHAAAAVHTKAIVIFGGFIPPEVTGYDLHANLTGGAEACGSLRECSHCRDAMRRITADEIFDRCLSILNC
jgi:hypothetical protein